MLHRKKGLRPNGFTLLELCLVLTILGGLVTLLFSSLLISSEQVVRAELDRLHSICIYLQRKARIENKRYSLVFDTDNNSYSGDVNGALHLGVRFGRCKKGTRECCTFVQNRLQVSPDGTLSPGAIYLTDSTHQVQYALTVDVATVRGLRKYRYDEEWVCVDSNHQVH